MSDTQLATLSTINDTGVSVDNIILPATAVEGLKPVQITVMKETVLTVNNNTRLAGELLRSTAAALYELKQNLVNKQWIAFLKSGALPITEKKARDLCGAWEDWIRDSDVTDGDLVSIGARTLAKIKSLKPGEKKKMIGKIKAGQKVTEKDVDDIRKKVSTLANGVDADNYESITKDLKGVATELIANNNKFRTENNSMTKKVEELTKKVQLLEEQNKKYLDKIAELEAAAAATV